MIAPAPVAIHQVSTARLREELERREQSEGRLRSRRDEIARQLAEIDAELDHLSPRKDAPQPVGVRAVNVRSLPDMLAQVVEPDDAGFVSHSRTFPQAVAARHVPAMARSFIETAATSDARPSLLLRYRT